MSLILKIGFFALDLFRPFFGLFSGRKKEFFGRLRSLFKEDPYLCGMIGRFGTWHEWIFRPFFEKVRTDSAELSSLKELAARNTLVYVMKNRGQLEYSFFNHLFLREDIPLARFANGSRTLFWRPIGEMIRAGLARLDNYYEHGLLEDPLESGYLENRVAFGESALLNLKVSREFVFNTGEDPLRFIPPLIRAARKSAKPVYLVTQQFLYDRHPEKVQKSFVDLLFGEKSNPGMIRKLILFLMTYRKRATVKFGEPFNLTQFVREREASDEMDLAAQLKSILLNRLSVERKSITGPALKPKEKFLETMLRSRAFKEEVEKLALATGRNRAGLEKEISKYFVEIAASVNYSYVDLYDILIRWMINHVYDGLDINTEGLSRIKAIAGKNPVVVVSSHRSHIDYLLLSYIFYNYDLTLPHVCAGINLKFWPADQIIRRGGGFYIRRTLEGNQVYRLTLEHYLKMLVREGYSIEFFIEGTRSRTGKLLKPKMGILSMLIKTWLDGEASDIYFVPLSIGYERIMEEKSYVSEAHGSAKEKENVAGILKAAGGKFRKKYGKVFVRFAEPISLKSFFEEKGVLPLQKGVEECRRDVGDFAYRLTYNINRVAVVTSSSLVSAALLSYPKKGIPEEVVINRAKLLEHYLHYKGAELTDIIRQKGEWAYLESLQRLGADRMISAHRDFREKFYTVDESKRILLDYHKNNSLHFFVSLAVFSKIVQASRELSMPLPEIRNRYEIIKRLLSQDFTFSERAALDDHLKRVIGFYVREELMGFDETSGVVSFLNSREHPAFRLYASLIDNFYETAYFTLLYLKYVPVQKMEKARLVKAIMEAGRSLYLKGDLHYPEALSQFNIVNALAAFEEAGLVKIEEKKWVTATADGESLLQWEELLASLLGLEEGGVSHQTLREWQERTLTPPQEEGKNLSGFH